jgi:hypothetical protein
MSTTFLVFALLFPRPTLLVCWLCGTLPTNDTPFAADVLGALLAPRLLLGWWTHADATVHPVWTALFVGLFVLSTLFGGARARSRE